MRFVNTNGIELILDSFSDKDILEMINHSILFNAKKREPLRLRRKSKLQNINTLLSNKELEVALMLIKGEKTKDISAKMNLAITTISTYKKRIFEKTKVKSSIEMAALFNKIH